MAAKKKPPRVCARCGGKKGPKYENRKYCGKCLPAVRREQRQRAHRTAVGVRYNLKPGQYDQILIKQGGVCPICLRANGRTKALSVDHDHTCCKTPPTCGKCTRGLLCGPCNRMLGHGRDDPEFFERAAEYLRNPPAKGIV